MGVLQNKIDFLAVVSVTHANPNGDPLNGNMPRTTYSGYGEISDVCLKRKIRNRWMDMGQAVFVQSDDKNIDGYQSLRERADANKRLGEEAGKGKKADRDTYAAIACEEWIDVRGFGQVFAFKGSELSVGVRGPISIHPAFSIEPVDINSIQITKSVNSESGTAGKASDTMGMKHRVEFGVYVIKGSVNVQLAEKTRFTEEDAHQLKEALQTLFYNDCSSARPDGSMEMCKLFWWTHSNKLGQYSSKTVHDSVTIAKKDGIVVASKVSDYDISYKELDSLEVEIVDGV